jgi:hypothetical protein
MRDAQAKLRRANFFMTKCIMLKRKRREISKGDAM